MTREELLEKVKNNIRMSPSQYASVKDMIDEKKEQLMQEHGETHAQMIVDLVHMLSLLTSVQTLATSAEMPMILKKAIFPTLMANISDLYIAVRCQGVENEKVLDLFKIACNFNDETIAQFNLAMSETKGTA